MTFLKVDVHHSIVTVGTIVGLKSRLAASLAADSSEAMVAIGAAVSTSLPASLAAGSSDAMAAPGPISVAMAVEQVIDVSTVFAEGEASCALCPLPVYNVQAQQAMVKRSHEVASHSWIGQMDLLVFSCVLKKNISLHIGDTVSPVHLLVNGRCGSDFLSRLA